MRELEGGPARTMTPEEEEELLNYSEEEGAGADVDAEMPDPGEREETEEEARLRAERKAEEEDRNAKLAEIQERIRRRKAERERRLDDMRRREEELWQAEQDRIRAEKEQDRILATAAEEKRMQQMQIEKLEEELRRAKEAAGNIEQENENDEGENGRHLKRGRSKSEDSRQESTFSGTVGANLLNLPAGYRAVRSTKLNSLAVRHLNGGSAIPFKTIGSFANEYDARIKLANIFSDSVSSRNISSSFNLASFVCNTCTTRGEHVVLGKKSDRNDGTGQTPIASCCRIKTSRQ
jgi:hypothetical protein